LIGPARKTEQGVHSRQHEPGGGAGDEAKQRIARDGSHGEARAGAAKHLTLHTQIYDSYLLRKRLAQCYQKKWRR
jgi:hypothetical protein